MACWRYWVKAAQNQPPRPDLSLENQPSRKGALILLAEDQPVNQQVGCICCGILGYEVEVVNNGREAVDASAKKTYDLILMDCHMPEMDGFEATKAIRIREQSAAEPHRLPIIALTADVQKGISEQCLASGMDSYLSKPFNKQQLQRALHQWLADKPYRNASAAPENAPGANNRLRIR